MRRAVSHRLLIPILGLALSLAAPAGAQQDAGLRGPVTPGRGAVGDPQPTVQGSPLPIAPSPTPTIPETPSLAASRPAYAAGQCRLNCAQSYYFCLASDMIDDCGAGWGQCQARCDTAAP